jgi:hypothetical protein
LVSFESVKFILKTILVLVDYFYVENNWIFIFYFAACDARGTSSEADGNCTCKKYVTGKNCNECIIGTWNLLQTNKLGCQSKYF